MDKNSGSMIAIYFLDSAAHFPSKIIKPDPYLFLISQDWLSNTDKTSRNEAESPISPVQVKFSLFTA